MPRESTHFHSPWLVRTRCSFTYAGVRPVRWASRGPHLREVVGVRCSSSATARLPCSAASSPYIASSCGETTSSPVARFQSQTPSPTLSRASFQRCSLSQQRRLRMLERGDVDDHAHAHVARRVRRRRRRRHLQPFHRAVGEYHAVLDLQRCAGLAAPLRSPARRAGDPLDGAGCVSAGCSAAVAAA